MFHQCFVKSLKHIVDEIDTQAHKDKVSALKNMDVLQYVAGNGRLMHMINWFENLSPKISEIS